MDTARKFIGLLGSDALRDTLALKYGTLNRWAENGRIPAAWYFALKSLCDERGLDCPPGLFNFRMAPALPQKTPNSAATNQSSKLS